MFFYCIVSYLHIILFSNRAGFSLSSLKAARYCVSELKAVGYSAEELKGM